MSHTKFTPGPWCWKTKWGVDETGKGGYAVARRGKGEYEAVLVSESSEVARKHRLVLVGESMADGWGDIADANCNLIAAAPELYAALEDLICLCEAGLESEYDINAELADAKAAIAKARGEA